MVFNGHAKVKTTDAPGLEFGQKFTNEAGAQALALRTRQEIDVEVGGVFGGEIRHRDWLVDQLTNPRFEGAPRGIFRLG